MCRLSPSFSGLAEELFARKRRAKQRYVWRMSPVWVSWEVACFGLMVGALVSLYLYVFQLSPDTPTATTYDVYDADVMAPARFFMVRKNESGWNPYLANVLQVRQRGGSAWTGLGHAWVTQQSLPRADLRACHTNLRSHRTNTVTLRVL